MKCPGCKKKQEEFAICDDECGTFICLECDVHFYFTYHNNKMVAVLGHDSLCYQKHFEEQDAEQ